MDGLKKMDFKDLRGKEIVIWLILLLNLTAFLMHCFTGNLFFVVFNGAATVWMAFTIEKYYQNER